MVLLGPFREMKTGVDASDEPVLQNMVNQKGSGRKAKRVLVVYHLNCEGSRWSCMSSQHLILLRQAEILGAKVVDPCGQRG